MLNQFRMLSFGTYYVQGPWPGTLRNIKMSKAYFLLSRTLYSRGGLGGDIFNTVKRTKRQH